jgi:hypothetical protein
MAERCHDQLVMMGPMPLPSATFADWQTFLIALYDNAWKVYPLHADLMGSTEQEYLQRSFEAVRDAAKAALLELQDMYATEPSRKARDAVVTKMSRLVTILVATKEQLAQ